MQPELEAGRDPEVSAAAADRPEQVRVGLCVHAQQLAVRGHDLGGQQVIDRQAVLADEVSDPAAQRKPPDPDRAGVAEPGRQAVSCRRRCIRRRSSPSRPRGAAARHRSAAPACPREVEHDPAVGDAVARRCCGRRCGRPAPVPVSRASEMT